MAFELNLTQMDSTKKQNLARKTIYKQELKVINF